MMKKQQKERFTCAYCGKRALRARRWQRFCSPACRLNAWNDANPRIRRQELERLKRAAEAREGGQ